MAGEDVEIRLMMVAEKDTANTKRFEEVPPPGGTEHIKKLYLSRATLRRLGNPTGLEVIIRPLRSEGRG